VNLTEVMMNLDDAAVLNVAADALVSRLAITHHART
jgi:hypothetical protein